MSKRKKGCAGSFGKVRRRAELTVPVCQAQGLQGRGHMAPGQLQGLHIGQLALWALRMPPRKEEKLHPGFQMLRGGFHKQTQPRHQRFHTIPIDAPELSLQKRLQLQEGHSCPQAAILSM